MKKLKLNTFIKLTNQTRVRIGDKVIKLREERDLFGRFLIILGSRPGLVPKLEETIGHFEMSVVPRSLCAVDGSLLVPNDKSKLMHAIEDAKNEDMLTNHTSSTTVCASKVLILDAMAIIHPMKKSAKIRTLYDLQVEFIKLIEEKLDGYDEARIVFDRYIDLSLKNKTRQVRSKTSTEYLIHPEMRLTMSIKDLLSSSKTKQSLTIMFAKALIEYFSNKETRVFVIYDNKIVGPDTLEEHTHEEADTLIPHQVLASVTDDKCRDITVASPDTDVFILLLDLVSNDHLNDQTRLQFRTGKGKWRVIDIKDRVRVVGKMKCQALVGFHNFTGADWGGKFVGKTKLTWTNAFMELTSDHPVLQCFKKLGEGNIESVLENGKLPSEFSTLEEFVCKVYSCKGPYSLPQLRWELFRSRNLEGEMLPPTRASLLPHIIRSNYVAMRDKSYTSACPVLPPIEENGWTIQDDVYIPTKCLSLPAPKAVIELTKCSCKLACTGNCGCYKSHLPCTPLCKCCTVGCSNEYDTGGNEDDDDAEDNE